MDTDCLLVHVPPPPQPIPPPPAQQLPVPSNLLLVASLPDQNNKKLFINGRQPCRPNLFRVSLYIGKCSIRFHYGLMPGFLEISSDTKKESC